MRSLQASTLTHPHFSGSTCHLISWRTRAISQSGPTASEKDEYSRDSLPFRTAFMQSIPFWQRSGLWVLDHNCEALALMFEPDGHWEVAGTHTLGPPSPFPLHGETRSSNFHSRAMGLCLTVLLIPYSLFPPSVIHAWFPEPLAYLTWPTTPPWTSL